MNVEDFLSSEVSSVMVDNVITFKTDTRLADAALDLLVGQISGAPITDDSGKCVGVISVVDLVGAEEKAEQRQEDLADEFFAKGDLLLPMHVFSEKLKSFGSEFASAGDQPVSNFMTRNLVTASEHDTLSSVISKMIDAHIHRVIVVNPEGQLRGIVSTTDILAALLRNGA